MVRSLGKIQTRHCKSAGRHEVHQPARVGLMANNLSQDLGDMAQAYDLIHRFFRGASIPAIRVQRTIRDLVSDIVTFTRLSEYVVDPRIASFVDRLNELRDDVRFENLAMRRKALRGVEKRECILGW